MEKDIKVSVLILTYNHKDYIQKSIESVLSQKTNFDYEVIIHDDCSTDGTQEIVKKYEDRCKIIIQPKNVWSQKIDIFTTFFVPNAKGKYLAVVEGDDYWIDEYKLQKQYDVLENNPSCSICTHKVKWTKSVNSDELKSYQPDEHYKIDKKGIYKSIDLVKKTYFFVEYPFHTSSYFIRREIVTGENTYAKWHNGIEFDIEILRSASLCGDFYYLDECMSTRRGEVPDSYTVRINHAGKDGKIEFYKRMVDKIDRYIKCNNKYYDDCLNAMYYCVTKMQKKDKKAAKEMFDKYHLSDLSIVTKVKLKLLIKYLIYSIIY